MNTDEEQAIINMVDEFANNWNQGDAKGVAGYFTEDGLRVDPSGDVQHGRAEIEAAYAKLLDEMSGASVEMGKSEIRLLGPDYATMHSDIEIKLPDGSSIPGHTMDVLQKVEGRWMILETHPKFNAPAP